MGKICTFFGNNDFDKQHRYNHALRMEILSLIYTEDVYTFYIGTNGNFEKFALAVLLDIKHNYYRDIKLVLVAVSPRELSQNAWAVDEAILPEEVKNAAKNSKLTKRNEFMLQNSDFVISYVDEDEGNAYNCIELAKSLNKEIIDMCDVKIPLSSTFILEEEDNNP